METLYANVLDSIVTSIEQHTLLPDQGTLVVAVSGGADSLCLLHLLHQLCGPDKRYPGVRLHAAHLNHQLRGTASQHDAATVEALVRSWHLPLTIGQVDVPTLARKEQRSLEEAARIARYRFLREVAQGSRIAVAHHFDDQVETLLLHWLRGGGLASMIGLQPLQQDIVRPLLGITHADTLAYCAHHGITPLDDASNTDPRFLRNRIRHELIPLLAQLNPGIRETLVRNAETMAVDFAWIETQLTNHWPSIVEAEDEEHIQLTIKPLCTLPLSLQRHLLRRVTARLCNGQSPLELRHYRLLEDLYTRSYTGETLTLHLPQTLHAIRVGNTLTFRHANPAQEEPDTPIEARLPIPGRIAVPRTSWIAEAELVPSELLQHVRAALVRQDWQTVWNFLPNNAYTVYVDAARLSNQATLTLPGLRVRTRLPGDRIRPLGMQFEKKVQDVLVNKHIPRAERDRLPLFFSEQHCVWLAGIHVDDRVRLTATTQQIVRLSIISTGDTAK